MRFLRFLTQTSDPPKRRAKSVQGEKLRLYELPYCYYCSKVRQVASELGISLKSVDVSRDPMAHRLLIEKLGRGTVPVLSIETKDGVKLLPESREIIAYLRSRSGPDSSPLSSRS